MIDKRLAVTLLGAALLGGCETKGSSATDAGIDDAAVIDALVFIDASNSCQGAADAWVNDPTHRDAGPAAATRNLDILFIVDNSTSMGEEQASLTANFPAFMSVLNNIPGGLPNVHIGVISSSVGASESQLPACSIASCPLGGDNGVLQNSAHGACTPPSGRFIVDELPAGASVRVKNYSGTLEDTFSCIARLGTSGCGFEQHLESMKRALDRSRAENAGFLRDDAYLAVIIIADEDDCSAIDSAVFDPRDRSLAELGPLNSFRCSEFGITCAEGHLTRGAASYTGCKPREDSPYIRHPQDYVDFLKSLKSDPNLIFVSGIFGNPDPVEVTVDDGLPKLHASCADPAGITGVADPGVRLHYFLEQFPNRNAFTSICNNDLSPGLTQIAEKLAAVIAAP